LNFLETVLRLLLEGLLFLRNYLFFPADGETFSLMRLMSLFIAFAISGAIIAFMPQGAVLRHMGPNAKRIKAYAVASVSGIILAVCSCSVLPMFAGIRKKGAGLGPAIAFLFSGPAINVLALTLTFTDLGPEIAIARVISAVVLALVIGLLMAFVFKRSEKRDTDANNFALMDVADGIKPWQKLLFFLTLFVMLIFGIYMPLPTLIVAGFLAIQLLLFFSRDNMKAWGYETFTLAKKIFPLFLIGIFFAGIMQAIITEDMLTQFVGRNRYPENLFAAVIGALMYFATLTEIPIIKALLDLGMHRGPATALLLAGPSLSLPNMIVISKVVGLKRGLVYFTLVIFISAAAGLIAGMIYGLL